MVLPSCMTIIDLIASQDSLKASECYCMFFISQVIHRTLNSIAKTYMVAHKQALRTWQRQEISNLVMCVDSRVNSNIKNYNSKCVKTS